EFVASFETGGNWHLINSDVHCRSPAYQTGRQTTGPHPLQDMEGTRMDLAKFFAGLRSRGSGIFGTSLSQAQVNGINGILAAFDTHGDGKPDTLAYAL